MSRRGPWAFGDALAAHAVLASAAAELLIRELYHGVSAEAVGTALVITTWLVMLVLLLVRARTTAPRARQHLGRATVLLAACVAVHVLVWPAFVAVTSQRVAGLRIAAYGAAGVLATLAAVWALRSDEPLWQRIRRAATIACVFFMASPIAFSSLAAPTLAWPPYPAEARPAERRSATLFLLFDELNAKSAGPLIDLLRSRGLKVESKGVVAVGDGTSKVVPAMFSGQRFDQAKPCSPSAICSASTALDFGRISAARPDIDVVGFFHPYCSIRGLRHCERLTTDSALVDPARWSCTLRRRLGLIGSDDAHCSAVYAHPWVDLNDAVIAALWRAPVWRDGGFLFAHLPLPHPPGADPKGSLQSHYQDNLERASRLVDEMLARLSNAGLEPKIVIFSDHPLRQKLWCSNYFPYRTSGCSLSPALIDDRVPVIAAGIDPPTLEGIHDNGHVFDLASSWR